VFALKAREKPKASAILIPSIEAWSSLVVEIPALARRLAEHFWPGPLTIALPAAASVNPLLAYRNLVAVRIPGHSPAYELLQAFGAPLTATSANPNGAASPLSAEEVRTYFGSRRELLVLTQPAPGGMPSTVLEVAGDAFKIVRPGAIPPSVLDEFCAEAAE
jgi:L-threonylcarbamoyladenylate synthase